MKSKLLLKRKFLIPAIYLILVVICIFVAFDFEGRINGIAWLILLLITLPWSLTSIIYNKLFLNPDVIELIETENLQSRGFQ